MKISAAKTIDRKIMGMNAAARSFAKATLAATTLTAIVLGATGAASAQYARPLASVSPGTDYSMGLSWYYATSLKPGASIVGYQLTRYDGRSETLAYTINLPVETYYRDTYNIQPGTLYVYRLRYQYSDGTVDSLFSEPYAVSNYVRNSTFGYYNPNWSFNGPFIFGDSSYSPYPFLGSTCAYLANYGDVAGAHTASQVITYAQVYQAGTPETVFGAYVYISVPNPSTNPPDEKVSFMLQDTTTGYTSFKGIGTIYTTDSSLWNKWTYVSFLVDENWLNNHFQYTHTNVLWVSCAANQYTESQFHSTILLDYVGLLFTVGYNN